ncbi:MAG: hypothetical protein MUO77_15390 [Anaerolineales bacterium]|nr:hypothetical protein [Anaerolineales bacterium]
MKEMNIKKAIVIFVHAIVGWGLCGAIIGIGRNVTTMGNTLIIHAIGVPIIFGLLSWLYFAKFRYTTPLQAAVIFVSFAILMDVFVIAMFVEKSFAMFVSILGTWIPFALIFLSTYLVGQYVTGVPVLSKTVNTPPAM